MKLNMIDELNRTGSQFVEQEGKDNEKKSLGDTLDQLFILEVHLVENYINAVD
jgi:hypothetical protein